MKAIINHRYGGPDALRYDDIATPTVGDDELLIRVHHAAVNPLDWHLLTGTPYLVRPTSGLRRPKQIVRGADMAGVVESVGDSVTGFDVGDRVVASSGGAFAELATAPASRAALVPDDIDLVDAAALPVAAITALQGLRDHGSLRFGQSVLVNGASGGVGTFAVQIAKAIGAQVTAVCSAANVDLVRSLGADHVIDYTTTDFTSTGIRHDVLLDNVGNRPLSACRQVLARTGVYVMVSGPKTSKIFGPVKRMVAAHATFAVSSQRAATVFADETAGDLCALIDMMNRGELRSVIDRRYSLADTAEAIRYVETGRARGKVIIDVIEATT